ncbi:6-phosphofructokinase [Carboxydocella sporoproducens DSM 16521]|uniref:ATP-dependent 6-phosphofructokinase n=3 Tax=Clostridiales Family XVI. Incertae Sedis TaxID=543347 RepID=A0A1T4QT55_9FIRM|nr:6-phosphofructokinase 1 [Carboxydocella thermautotrophica]AVX31231.1 6-phosphofructokinase 1 [Carboxydocella thermautotrophica]SKA06846.1 6-phosphofructokinase [Carboxydocella sporoproducens DSM 16521]
MLKRIGVLTGGGDCPGLNAVIRAVTKSALRAGLEVVGIEDGFGGLIRQQFRPLNLAAVSGILPKGGTILGTTNRDNPFKYPVLVNGEKKYVDMSQTILDNLAVAGIDALVVIGGDGSLSIARELHNKGLRVVGVPKTIDNDLSATDITFGFDTALHTATEALDKLHTTAESHHRVMILEVMGRYAGWIALESGVAGGADVILIPEIEFQIENVVKKIEERCQQGKKFSIIVVAEGAKLGENLVVQKVIEDSGDPIRLGGIGQRLADELERRINLETRVTVLGHLQRGGSPTPFDRILGTRYGAAAVEALLEGENGVMVALRTPDIVTVSLAEATGVLKRVNPEHDLVQAAKAIGISFGDE